MKNNILKISIFPLVAVVALSLADFQPGKENKGKGNNTEVKGNQDRGQGGKGNDNNSNNTGRGNQGNSKADNGQGKGKSTDNDRGNDDQGSRGNKSGNDQDKNDNSRGNSGNNGKSDNDRGNGKDNDNMNAGNGNKGDGKGNGKSRRETIKWDRDENINWGFENYSSRKRPKDFKKVTVCHNTGDSEFPVTISVSENALKAHLNHGDQAGNCNVNYSDRWPANFIRTRENVYNNYQTTWETMSYSEQLLRFAADKLLGIKSTFQTQRATLSPEEIQRREMLIMDLQNNVNSLENQLAVSRQRTEGLNININL